MRDSFRAARNVVRIVAGEAGHLTVAKTCGLAQPVRGMIDLEIVVVLVTCGLNVQLEIFQWLAWAIRKDGAIEGALLVGFFEACLKMTLHTHFKLPPAIEPPRIDDRRS